jgi:hypothetical protein
MRRVGEGDGVINVDTEVSTVILDAGVTQQDLHSPQIAGCPVDQRSFRSPHRVRALF